MCTQRIGCVLSSYFRIIQKMFSDDSPSIKGAPASTRLRSLHKRTVKGCSNDSSFAVTAQSQALRTKILPARAMLKQLKDDLLLGLVRLRQTL